MVKGLLSTSAPCSFLDTEEELQSVPPVSQMWCSSEFSCQKGAPACRHTLYPPSCTLGRGEPQSQLCKYRCLAGAEVHTMVRHIQGLSEHNKAMPRNRKMSWRPYRWVSWICSAPQSKQAGIVQGDKEAFLSKQCGTLSWVTSGGCLSAQSPFPCFDCSCILSVSRCGYLMHAHLCPQLQAVSA